MAGGTTFDFGAYLFGVSPGVGVNKEDLLDQITNVSPWDTPWTSQAPKVPLYLTEELKDNYLLEPRECFHTMKVIVKLEDAGNQQERWIPCPTPQRLARCPS
jgi:hypothetical protein